MSCIAVEHRDLGGQEKKNSHLVRWLIAAGLLWFFSLRSNILIEDLKAILIGNFIFKEDLRYSAVRRS